MEKIGSIAKWVGSGIVLILAAVGFGLVRGVTFFSFFEGEKEEGSEFSDPKIG